MTPHGIPSRMASCLLKALRRSITHPWVGLAYFTIPGPPFSYLLGSIFHKLAWENNLLSLSLRFLFYKRGTLITPLPHPKLAVIIRCEPLSLQPSRTWAGTKTKDKTMFDNFFNKLLKWFIFILFCFSSSSVPLGTLHKNTPIGAFFSLVRTKCGMGAGIPLRRTWETKAQLFIGFCLNEDHPPPPPSEDSAVDVAREKAGAEFPRSRSSGDSCWRVTWLCL